MEDDEASALLIWSGQNASVAASILASSGVLLAIALVSWPLPDAEQARQALRPIAMVLAGEGARDCGFATDVRDDTAWRCVQTALAAHEAFWVISGRHAEDSMLWRVIHRHAAGELRHMDFDQLSISRLRSPLQASGDLPCPALTRADSVQNLEWPIDCDSSPG